LSPSTLFILLFLVTIPYDLYFLYAFLFFFFHDPAPPQIYTLSLHDALPICALVGRPPILVLDDPFASVDASKEEEIVGNLRVHRDRKSTRLNSSHVAISYAVFCLKKKKYETNNTLQMKLVGGMRGCDRRGGI